jgi:hypothetical protein
LLDELMQRIRQFAGLIGAALAQLSRYLFGNVADPTLRQIKANDANGVAVPSFPQIVDDCFKIGVFNVCLAPSTTPAEIVEDQIDSRPRRTRKALIGDSIFLAKGDLDCRLSGSGASKACDFIFKIPSNRRA